MEFKDRITLKGTVAAVHNIEAKGMSLLVLAIRGKEVNFPCCLCFGDVKDKTLLLKKGDHVAVEGIIESKRIPVLDESGNSIATKYTQAIIATELSELKSTEEVEFGVAGRTYPSENKVILAGTVNSVKKFSDKKVGISVYILNGRIPNRIMAISFTADADKFINQYEKGDKVCLIGEIQTLPPKNGLSKKEAVVVRSIKKIE